MILTSRASVARGVVLAQQDVGDRLCALHPGVPRVLLQIAPSRNPAEDLSEEMFQKQRESVARRYSPGGDTVILATNVSSGSKIIV